VPGERDQFNKLAVLSARVNRRPDVTTTTTITITKTSRVDSTHFNVSVKLQH